MKLKSLFIVGLVSLLIPTVSCTKKNKVVAEVGSSKITRGDVEMRQKAMQVLNPSTTFEAAMEQLIRSYTMVEILKARNEALTDEEVASEYEKLKKVSENNPKMAALFQQAKGNEKEFRNVVVIPMIADRLVFMKAYMKDEGFHASEKEKATKLHQTLKTQATNFTDSVKKNGGMVFEGTIKDDEGLKWNPSADKSQPMMGGIPQGPGIGKMWKERYLASAKPGTVVGELIEERNGYIVLYYANAGGKGAMNVKAGLIPKKSFGEWLQSQQKAVTVKRLLAEEKKS